MTGSLARFLPPFVVTGWVVLLSVGVSPETLRVPALVALAVAMFVAAAAELSYSRNDRRSGNDRRRQPR